MLTRFGVAWLARGERKRTFGELRPAAASTGRFLVRTTYRRCAVISPRRRPTKVQRPVIDVSGKTYLMQVDVCKDLDRLLRLTPTFHSSQTNQRRKLARRYAESVCWLLYPNC